jgi:hypothetical protein
LAPLEPRCMATVNGGSKLLSARAHRQIATIIRTTLGLGKKNLLIGTFRATSVRSWPAIRSVKSERPPGDHHHGSNRPTAGRHSVCGATLATVHAPAPVHPPLSLCIFTNVSGIYSQRGPTPCAPHARRRAQPGARLRTPGWPKPLVYHRTKLVRFRIDRTLWALKLRGRGAGLSAKAACKSPVTFRVASANNGVGSVLLGTPPRVLRIGGEKSGDARGHGRASGPSGL